MFMTKTDMNMDSHSYRNVQDENPYTMKWIVIHTEVCVTRTHSKRSGIIIRTEMCMTKTDMNMDSHSYINVTEENPCTMTWIVIHIEVCETKTHTKRIWIVIRTEI